MGLEKDIQISELYDLKSRFNSYTNRHYPWEENLLQKTTSPYMWKNSTMNEFLNKIQKMVILMVEQVNYSRNYFNPTVHKYYNDYWG
jgi:hypothetical protein